MAKKNTQTDRVSVRLGDLRWKLNRATEITGYAASVIVRTALADFLGGRVTKDQLVSGVKTWGGAK